LKNHESVLLHDTSQRLSSAPEIEDPINVRFQPIGLMASRCFKSSKGLSCGSCHDPHNDGSRVMTCHTLPHALRAALLNIAPNARVCETKRA
jgi:hypothetical protein